MKQQPLFLAGDFHFTDSKLRKVAHAKFAELSHHSRILLLRMVKDAHYTNSSSAHRQLCSFRKGPGVFTTKLTGYSWKQSSIDCYE